MIRWVLLDTAPAPDGQGKLRLMQRGGEFSITIGANELMNSRLGGSESALAAMACKRLGDRKAPSLLIGGLGMGFTLRAALAELGPGARITVAELVPAVVAWARWPLADVFDGCLSDLRVEVRQADVAELIGSGAGAYDAILLDVDNGPDGLVRQANDRLYGATGLAAARRALRPGGVLAVWSCAPDEAFTRRLKQAGYAVSEAHVRAHGTRGARHIVWIATTPAVSPDAQKKRPPEGGPKTLLK